MNDRYAKISTLIILLVLLIACDKTNTSKIYDNGKNEIAEISIEFPVFAKWTECLDFPEIKDKFDKEQNGITTIIAVYLKNDIIDMKDSINDIDFDDFAIILKRDYEQEWKINNDDLIKIFDLQIKKTKTKIKNLQTALDELKYGKLYRNSDKHIIIERFKPFDNVYSSIQLNKPLKDNSEIISTTIYNIINIKNHVFYLGYYLDFNGIESIEKAKLNNQKLLNGFIETNIQERDNNCYK